MLQPNDGRSRCVPDASGAEGNPGGGIGLIVQARTGSTRLPGKVLRKAAGKPMLQYLLETLSRSGLGRVVGVTSARPEDGAVAELCGSLGIACVRGDEEDVASRFEAAVREFGFAAFVRVCGDSPLMDMGLVRRGLEVFARSGSDLVTNTFPRSFPKGQSVEVVLSASFLAARACFDDAADREHVTRHFYRHPERFRIVNFTGPGDWSALQLSVDTAEDFDRFEALLGRARRPHWEYSWDEWAEMARGLEAQGGGAGIGA